MASTSTASQSKNRRNTADDETDPEEILKGLQNQMFKIFDTKNPVEQLKPLIDKAKILEDLFDIHFRDEYGYTLLGTAVKSYNMDVIRYLFEQHNFKVKEELIIAVDLDYKEAVDYIIKQNPELVNRKTLAGTVCRPGMSPVMKASLMENESMLKFLLARGGKPLSIPEFNPSETNNIIRFDAIYQSLVALSQPVYLCVMNEDPIMVAFKIAETCEKFSNVLQAAKDDLLSIKKKCENFATEFIRNIETFDELELILSQMTCEDQNIVAPGESYERLKYAMKNEHIDFVANGGIQKLVRRKFMDGPLAYTDFDSAHVVKKVLYITLLVLLTPFWLFLLMFFPASDSSTGKFVKSWIEMPFMMFIVQITLFITACVVISQSSNHLTAFNADEWAKNWEDALCLYNIEIGNTECIDDNNRYSQIERESFKRIGSFSQKMNWNTISNFVKYLFSK